MRSKKMSKKYLAEHKLSGFKVGDRVIIKMKAESCSRGWNNTWEPEMDDSIGEEGEIIEDNGETGFTIKFNDPALEDFDYPYFILEKNNS